MSEAIKKINRKDCIAFGEFDTKYNVETSHPVVEANDKSYGDFKPTYIDNSEKFPGSQGYQNTALHFIDTMNNYFKDIPRIDQYQLVDIGAGKGRVILHTLATSDIYKNYVGVEIDPEFSDIFKNNLVTTNIPINKPVEVQCGDGRDFICTNTPTVYFLFRPFEKEQWDEFIKKNLTVLRPAKAYFVFLHKFDYSWSDYFDTEVLYEEDGLSIYAT